MQVVDFDQDGRNDILVCDISRNGVLWYRQTAQGEWEEHRLGPELNVPAHATVVDLDGDDDLDVVVSILGDIQPSDELIGKVVVLENVGEDFQQRVILDDVRRVADVQPGDFDKDGDVDLAVAVFGYSRGEVLWLENRGGWRFRDHQLLFRPGAIHAPVADLDGDGDLDIAAIVSQDEEEMWGFENDGRGQFTPRRLYHTDNFDVGSAGLVLCDLDQDGDADFLLPQGDNLEDANLWPQPYHGCLWMENRGGWDFHPHRIAQYGLTYAAGAGDLDADGDVDVVLVSLNHDWGQTGQASIVWLENDGNQNFTTWRVDSHPVRLITVACGDLNGDGRADLVSGTLATPFFRSDGAPGVTAWISQGASP